MIYKKSNMNRANVMATIESIRLSETFDMSRYHWADDCGTPACIAGHACYASSVTSMPHTGEAVAGHAAHWLGLDDEKAKELFEPNSEHASFKADEGESWFISKERAIRVLENLLTTGVVDWENA